MLGPSQGVTLTIHLVQKIGQVNWDDQGAEGPPHLAKEASEFFIAPQTARIQVNELAADFERDQTIRDRKAAADAKSRWELHLKPFFGHLRAVQVGTDQISRYIEKRQDQGAANATINRELACLKRMFNLGVEASPPKVFRVPKFPKLAERNVRTGFVEDSDYSKLAQACGEVGLWMRAIFEIAYTYGWRVGELQNLKVRQIDIPSGTMRLNSGETKNDEGRLVVMTSKVQQLLTECVTGKEPGDQVFTRSGTSESRGERSVSRQSYRDFCFTIYVAQRSGTWCVREYRK
jgi:site-specific recombinase XerD